MFSPFIQLVNMLLFYLILCEISNNFAAEKVLLHLICNRPVFYLFKNLSLLLSLTFICVYSPSKQTFPSINAPRVIIYRSVSTHFGCSSWDRRSVIANFIPTVDDSTPIDSPCSVVHGQFLDRLGFFFPRTRFIYFLSLLVNNCHNNNFPPFRLHYKT